MPEIVDGNNCLGRIGAKSRDTLVSELAELARAKGKAVTVVFDGPPETGRPRVQRLGSVTVVFAAPRSADDEIVRRLQEARDPRGFTVITDDRALQSAVRATGCRVLGLAAFRKEGANRLRQAPDKNLQPSTAGLRDWEAWFADSRNRLT